jgi:NAD(P)-dependent dehydrogenase (short-subunit alcohol dehydrogenase family)
MAGTQLPLEGKAALITGGGSGIGLGCARHLLRDGASVTISGRSEDRLRAAAKELEAEAPAGASVRWVTCDVADEDEVVASVAVASEAVGGLHLAVSSAGTGTMGPVVAMPKDQWDSVMATNLTGTFLTLKHTASAMARAGGGSFVGISSIAGPLTHRFMAAYCVSKAAVETLVRNAADELGHVGVRVNAVRPGLVPTELAAPLEDDPAVHDDYIAQMPMGRTGTVDDVAALVRFLLGPESTWITGQIIGVDGGHTLRRGPNIEHWARALYGDALIDTMDPGGAS